MTTGSGGVEGRGAERPQERVLLSDDERGRKALYRAAGDGDAGRIERLLAEGAGVDARMDDGQAPLHWAAAKGADASARDCDGAMPLHLAAGLSPEPAVIAVLLAGGADLEALDGEGRTPLHRAAAFSDSPAFVAALLAASADAGARDESLAEIIPGAGP